MIDDIAEMRKKDTTNHVRALFETGLFHFFIDKSESKRRQSERNFHKTVFRTLTMMSVRCGFDAPAPKTAGSVRIGVKVRRNHLPQITPRCCRADNIPCIRAKRFLFDNLELKRGF